MKTFRLLRYFLVVILIATPVVTGATALLTADRFRRELLDEARIYATEVAENVYNQVEKRVLDPATGRSLAGDLTRDPEALAHMEEVVGLATHRHRVQQIYIFKPDGTTFFSTVREHIGRSMPPGNEHFREAVAGRVSSAVRSQERSPDISTTPRGQELLETYVPIFSEPGPGGRLVAVVEVYQDMRLLQGAMNRVTIWTVLVALLSMAVLGGLFALITVKADRVICQRENEILASNSALQKLSNDLEGQVKERTRQLLQKEKLASLGTLAAGVAHEINNPLATIGASAEGSLNRLRGRIPEPTLDEVKGYLELIGDEVYRCKRITENLLDFSRQQSSAASQPIDLGQIVLQTVELVRLGEGARRVAIELDLGEETDGVEGDPIQVRQVVHNLLANSLTAVKDRPDPRIRMRTRFSASEVWLECLDNGPGIPAAIRDQVFEPFFTTKPPGQGTGLGLAVCYSIAEQHGGAIEIVETRSDLDGLAWKEQVGARLRLRLPRRAQERHRNRLPTGEAGRP
jgi:signal transduction histidine kinase